jgi:hypothetical protein
VKEIGVQVLHDRDEWRRHTVVVEVGAGSKSLELSKNRRAEPCCHVGIGGVLKGLRR